MADYNSAYTGAEIDQGVGNGLAAPTTYAPIAHDSTATTYGKGTDTKYGHLKLSSSTSSTSGTSGGIAATPSAVKAAYDLANGKQDPATTLAGYGITDAASSAELGTFVRPNLLDNAYFIGGGSQQGGGQFPINQRGLTSYTGSNNMYGIDRWRSNQSTDTVEILATGVKCKAGQSSQGWRFNQVIEGMEALIGKQLTLSALIVAYQGTKWSFYVSFRNSSNTEIAYQAMPIGTGLQSVTATAPANTAKIQVGMYGENGVASGDYMTFEAVKLELGSTQTLAHQENGVWVLNEIPNYQQELARCQRFQIAVRNFARLRVARVTSGQLDFFLPLPVTMNGAGGANNNPTLEDPSSILAVYNTGGTAQTGFTFSCSTNGANGVTIQAVKSSHGLTDGYLQFGSNTDSVIINRNL